VNLFLRGVSINPAELKRRSRSDERQRDIVTNSFFNAGAAIRTDVAISE